MSDTRGRIDLRPISTFCRIDVVLQVGQGDLVWSTVRSVTSSGVFVSLSKQQDALIPISQVCSTGRVTLWGPDGGGRGGVTFPLLGGGRGGVTFPSLGGGRGGVTFSLLVSLSSRVFSN